MKKDFLFCLHFTSFLLNPNAFPIKNPITNGLSEWLTKFKECVNVLLLCTSSCPTTNYNTFCMFEEEL